MAKTTSDLSQVTKDQIEQIAHPVELHFDCDDLERVSQVKRSRVSAPSDDDDDILCGSNEHLLEENVPPDHVEPSGFQKEYSSLTEDASNIGDESLNQEEYAESWLHQHAMKLDDLYYDKLQKTSENMECPSGMSEAESDDLELPENLEEMLCDEHTDKKKDNTNQQDQSLYEGCPITVGISMLLIMTVAMCHGMTGNLHSLLHMADDIRNLGLLWPHSTFPFESLNGELLKLFHGTQNIVSQIVGAVNINLVHLVHLVQSTGRRIRSSSLLFETNIVKQPQK